MSTGQVSTGQVSAAPSGALTFARYAYPPNARGLCGPGDAAGLIERADAGTDDGGVQALARDFEGAWPYLVFVAALLGFDDPLDDQVVRAYWLGDPRLDRISRSTLSGYLDERFRHRAGSGWAHIAAAVAAGAVPTHDCHVLAVSPWTGLLRGPHADVAVDTLDACRIRVGTLERRVGGHHGLVATTALRIDEQGRLWEQPALVEARLVDDTGHRLVPDLRVGDRVALHWGWVCDRLSPRAAARATASTARALHLQARPHRDRA